MSEWTAWHERHAEKIELVAGVDCWIWTAATGAGGYGRVSYHQKAEMAHRAAFLESKGPIPAGLFVRHMCGNRFCVRPSHLRVGTAAENAKDTAEMFATTSRLTPDEVRSIREMYDDGVPLTEIAELHGVAFGTVYPIVCYKSFRHLDPEQRGKHNMRSPRKLTAETVAEIRARLAAGEGPQSRIAAEYGVRQSAISRIKTGIRWTRSARVKE